MDQDDSSDPFLGVKLWVDDVTTSLRDLERPPKPGLTINIENDEGEVSFISKLLQERKNIEQDVEITIANKTGSVTFDAHSSWNVGGWAKLCLATGAVFWYRNEIRIIARGILAGANLAIEKWDETQAEKERELLEGQDARTKTPARRESHVSVTFKASYPPTAQNCGFASSFAHMPPPEGPEPVDYVGSIVDVSLRNPACGQSIDSARGMNGAQPCGH